jgi:hypothetical protein
MSDLNTAPGQLRNLNSSGIQAYVIDGRVNVELMLSDLIAALKIGGTRKDQLVTAIDALWPQVEVKQIAQPAAPEGTNAQTARGESNRSNL